MFSRFMTVALVSMMTATAAAKDLEALDADRSAAFDGTAAERAVGAVRVAKRLPRMTGEQLLAGLRSRVLMQSTADDASAGAVWDESSDEDGTRRTLRRYVPSSAGPKVARFPEATLRARGRPIFTDVSLTARASELAAQIAQAEDLLGPGEELRAENTVLLRQMVEGSAESTVLSAMVVFRRYLNGVAILSQDGHMTMDFDAVDGHLLEVSVPLTRYTVVETKPARAGGRGRKAVDDGLARLGFTQSVVRRGQVVRQGNADVNVADFRCGFINVDGGDQLKAGCELRTTDVRGNGQAKRFLLD